MAGWRCGCLFAEPLPTVHKRQLRFTQGAGISPSTQEALDWSGRRHRAVCGPLDGLSIPPLAGQHGHLGNEPILLAQKLGCVVASPRQRSLSLSHAPTMRMPRLGVVDRVRECAPTVRSGRLLSAGNEVPQRRIHATERLCGMQGSLQQE